MNEQINKQMDKYTLKQNGFFQSYLSDTCGCNDGGTPLLLGYLSSKFWPPAS